MTTTTTTSFTKTQEIGQFLFYGFLGPTTNAPAYINLSKQVPCHYSFVTLVAVAAAAGLT